MKRDLINSVVVITGASSGLGRAIAREFADRGAKLVLAARRKDHLKDAARECEARGTEATYLGCDVRDEGDVMRVASSANRTFGRIDVWVNDAGVGAVGDFDEMPPKVFREVIETNFFGTVHGCRAALRYMKPQNEGVIINIGSQTSAAGLPRYSAYMSSKFAVRGLGQALREELTGTDIYVCTVMPSAIDTPFFQHAANYSGEKLKAMRPVMDAEKVAHQVVELANSPQDEIFVGSASKSMSALRAVAPKVYENLAGRVLYRDHFENAPAKPTSGAVVKPMRDTLGVSGGWLEREGRRTRRELGFTIAAVAPLAVGLYFATKRRGREYDERIEAAA